MINRYQSHNGTVETVYEREARIGGPNHCKGCERDRIDCTMTRGRFLCPACFDREMAERRAKAGK